MRKNIAIILAGGSGRRMGGAVPKQFLPLNGRTILERSIDAFCSHPAIAEVALVVHPDYVALAKELAARNQWARFTQILTGGAERSDSSLAAIRAYAGQDVNLLFHDAVRPGVTPRIINDCCQALLEAEAVVTAVPCVDTIYELSPGGTLARIPPRATLRRAQTPQGFRGAVITEAYRRAAGDPEFCATDDCGVVKRYLPEVDIALVAGDEANFKITFPSDLQR